ncbi:hypothetical protein V8G54_005151, partial [Vigna mungo]
MMKHVANDPYLLQSLVLENKWYHRLNKWVLHFRFLYREVDCENDGNLGLPNSFFNLFFPIQSNLEPISEQSMMKHVIKDPYLLQSLVLENRWYHRLNKWVFQFGFLYREVHCENDGNL